MRINRLKKRLLPIWWFTRCLFGSSKLRPFDSEKWWKGHTTKYQKDWEEFCERTPEEQQQTLKDRIDQLAAITEDLKSISGRTPLLGTIATAVLAAVFFLVKDGDPAFMWLVKVAFILLVLNFFFLLILAAPSFASIYKHFNSASDWQKLLAGPQARYTWLMMQLDRKQGRADQLKASQIRAIVLLIVGCIPLGVALVLR